MEEGRHTPGILYQAIHIHKIDNFCINKIEVFDENGEYKSVVATWDYVKIRVHYTARMRVKNGSAVLSVMTIDNTRLLLCSTMPDKKVEMEIPEGEHYFDCTFESWPTAAGEYVLHAALAVPMREWLCQTEPVLLSIVEKDIFSSGMPPNNSRYLIAVPYEITPVKVDIGSY